MNYFLLLPNQIFDKKYLDKSYNFIIYEHPHYFDSYKYNKKKLILHYSSLNYYYDYLKKNNFKVSYLKKDEKFKLKDYTLFDPIDKINLKGNYNLLDSPNFLLNFELINNYRDKTKSFFFHYFFNLNFCSNSMMNPICNMLRRNSKSCSIFHQANIVNIRNF